MAVKSINSWIDSIAYMATIGILLSLAPASSAQHEHSVSSDELLKAYVEAIELDAVQRFRDIKAELEADLTTEDRAELLKEAILLAVDTGSISDIMGFGGSAKALAQLINDQELMVYAAVAEAYGLSLVGKEDEAKVKAEAVKAFAESTGVQTSIYFANTQTTFITSELSGSLDALAYMTTEATKLPQTKRGKWMQVQARLILAHNYLDIAHVDDVLTYYLEALEIAKTEDIAIERETVLHNVALAHLNADDFENAKKYYEGLRQVTLQNDSDVGQFFVHYGLARLEHAQGNYAKAIQEIKAALEQPYNDYTYFVTVLVDLAAISYAKLGNTSEAEKWLNQPQQFVGEIKMDKSATPYAAFTRAHILQSKGAADDAFQQLDDAWAKYSNETEKQYADNVRAIHGKLEAVLKQWQAEEALKVAERTNFQLLVVLGSLLLFGLAGVVYMQYRHNHALKQSRAEAEKANRIKSEFLANMSHELRTPLNAVIGFSEMMEQRVFGDLGASQYEDYAYHIHESGKHLLDIINDILDLSKIEAGQVHLHENELDLAALLNEVRMLVLHKAHQKQITIQSHTPDELPLLKADRRLIKQILLNVVGNAVKFTSNEGEVSLTIETDLEGNFVIKVKDNGPGMSNEEIDLALRPFGQAGSTITRSHEGTGLGLPLAKTLTELHQGTLAVHSEKDQGTVVEIILPCARRLNTANVSDNRLAG